MLVRVVRLLRHAQPAQRGPMLLQDRVVVHRVQQVPTMPARDRRAVQLALLVLITLVRAAQLPALARRVQQVPIMPALGRRAARCVRQAPKMLVRAVRLLRHAQRAQRALTLPQGRRAVHLVGWALIRPARVKRVVRFVLQVPIILHKEVPQPVFVRLVLQVLIALAQAVRMLASVCPVQMVATL